MFIVVFYAREMWWVGIESTGWTDVGLCEYRKLQPYEKRCLGWNLNECVGSSRQQTTVCVIGVMHAGVCWQMRTMFAVWGKWYSITHIELMRLGVVTMITHITTLAWFSRLDPWLGKKHNVNVWCRRALLSVWIVQCCLCCRVECAWGALMPKL